MTTAGQGSTPTVLDLLFGPDADAAGTLAGEILSPGGDQDLGRALARLPEMTREAAVREAAAAAAGLLKVDLVGVLVRGWREHRDIVSAARRTLAAPASTELVSMSAHEVMLEQHPFVRVLVDSQRVATLELGLSIVFDVDALLLLISGGRLVAVRSGRCDVTATLAVQGTDLLVRQAHLELPGLIPLGQGIRLLPAGEYPARADLPGEGIGGDPWGSDPRASEPGGGDPRGGEHTSSGAQESEFPVAKEAPSVPW
jgi:hypothetical protein